MADDHGVEQWVFQGVNVGAMGLNAVVTWPKEEWGMDPTTFAEMRPGAYDIHERVRDMNRNGILASMCFPTFAGFSAGTFMQRATKDLAAIIRRTTTGTSTSGAARTRPVHPAAIVPVSDPRSWSTR